MLLIMSVVEQSLLNNANNLRQFMHLSIILLSNEVSI
jgi:hypothetical protein